MKNTPTTIQNTELILKKSKATLDIGRRILSGSKSLATKSDNLVLHSDVMMINGLMWNKETAEEMKWDDAMEYAQNLRLGGYEDWRLPTIKEFAEVVRFCGGISTTDRSNGWRKIKFENNKNQSYQVSYKEKGFTSNSYWSSTIDAGRSGITLYVDFYRGVQYYLPKTSSCYVRCVRAGQ